MYADRSLHKKLKINYKNCKRILIRLEYLSFEIVISYIHKKKNEINKVYRIDRPFLKSKI